MVRNFKKTMGRVTNGGHKFDAGGHYNQLSPQQSAKHYSVADMPRFRSETRDGVTGK